MQETVELSVLHIGDLTDQQFERWYACMGPEKKKRVLGFRFPEDQKRSVAAEMLARTAIARRCGVAPESILFRTTAEGKPFPKDLDIAFSVSHSGDWVACATSDSPVGVDIEQIRPIRARVALRVCTPEELTSVFPGGVSEDPSVVLTDPDTLIRFYRIWTAKEAYLKYLGTGIDRKLSCVRVPARQLNTVQTDDYILSIFSDP